MATDDTFNGWAILELLGHRRLGGRVCEQTLAGVPFLRIDIPHGTTASLTQFYAPGVVYSLTPTSEEAARLVASHNQPEPVYRFELPQLPAPPPLQEYDDTELKGLF